MVVEYEFRQVPEQLIGLIEACVPYFATMRKNEQNESAAAGAWLAFSSFGPEGRLAIDRKLDECDMIHVYNAPLSDLCFIVMHCGEEKALLFSTNDETAEAAAYLRARAQARLVPWWRSKIYRADLALVILCLVVSSAMPFFFKAMMSHEEWTHGGLREGIVFSLFILATAAWSAWMSSRRWKEIAEKIRCGLTAIPA